MGDFAAQLKDFGTARAGGGVTLTLSHLLAAYLLRKIQEIPYIDIMSGSKKETFDISAPAAPLNTDLEQLVVDKAVAETALTGHKAVREMSRNAADRFLASRAKARAEEIALVGTLAPSALLGETQGRIESLLRAVNDAIAEGQLKGLATAQDAIEKHIRIAASIAQQTGRGDLNETYVIVESGDDPVKLATAKLLGTDR